MRIGILGGSFNPPHKRHLEMGLELINKHYVDKIIYVPTGSKYKYKSNLISDEDRYEMVRLLIKDYDCLSVSDFELKDEVVYTYETLEHFKREFPLDEICFICGTDNLTYMDKWKNGLSLLENYKIIVIKRKTDDINEILERFKEYRDNIIVTDLKESDISSTIIRECIGNGEDVGDMLSKDIKEYIDVNGLYERMYGDEKDIKEV